MFMDSTKRRNPELIEAAIHLHQTGAILPDTYVLDLDMIEKNANKIQKSAVENGIELFYMTKQFGRNPFVSKKLADIGMKNAVAVDFREAQMLMDNQLPLGNVGHLVQIPQHLLERVVTYGSKYITVYSLDMLKKLNTIAKKLDKKQEILLRIVSDGDQLYPGQYGGFKIEEVTDLIPRLKALKNLSIKGITSFPCFLFNPKTKELEYTQNVETIKKAQLLFKEANMEVTELNIPSATCTRTMPLIKALGGTQGEPGHALTGTTPMHAVIDLPEKPAMVYVSEISHQYGKGSYCFGGGYYRRGHLKHALIDDGKKRYVAEMAPFADENIDYYLEIREQHPIGATVIMAFRTQIFVTRSEVAVVSGIQSGKLKIEGIYDSQGKLIRR